VEKYRTRRKDRLFHGEITSIEGLLGPSVRDKIKRVVVVCEEEGLSWPLLLAGEFTPLLFSNFPNAEVVTYDPVSQLRKPPQGRALITPDGSFTEDCGRWRDGKENETIVFFLGRVEGIDKDTCDRMRAGLAVGIEQYTPEGDEKRLGDVKITVPNEVEVRDFQLHTNGVTCQERQQYILARLGFANSRSGESLTITPDQFSQYLLKTIREVEEKIPVAAQGKPVIFANILKGMSGMPQFEGGWMSALKTLVQEVDATVIINEGPESWKEPVDGVEPQTRIMWAYDDLETTANKKATLVKVGSNDITRLAALLHIADKTGGCLVDIQTGTSHLADALNTPEVVVVPSHDPGLGDYLRERENLIRTSDCMAVVPAVKNLIR